MTPITDIAAPRRFLWVHFQVANIRNESTPRAVRNTLDSLAVDMDAVYVKILAKLREDTKQNRLLATRALAWVLCASRPLSVGELTEALALDRKTRRIDPESRCDEERILDVCLNLLVVEKQGGNSFFRFVHFSAQEFLRTRLDILNGDVEIGLTIDEAATHREILDSAVTYLSLDDFNIGPWNADTLYECREQFDFVTDSHPFVLYASSAWPRHLEQLDLPSKEEPLAAIVAFFNQMPALVLSFQIYWFREFSDGFPMNTTPLHIASFFGVTDLLRILLGTELADGLDAQDSSGRTPVHWATMNGHSGTMNLLLDAGAEIKALDKRNLNPMALAAAVGHNAIVKQLIQRQRASLEYEKEQLGIALLAATEGNSIVLVETILEAGADPNLQVHDSTDPLFVAASNGWMESAVLLLDAGADVDSGREYGNALQAAASCGAIGMIRLLLLRGADVNSLGGEGGSALNAAAFQGYHESVQLLLQEGAVIRQEGDVFGGALTLAESTGHSTVVDILLQEAQRRGIPESSLRPIPAQAGNTSTDAASPTAGVSLDAMKIAARSLFVAIRLGRMNVAKAMLTKGGGMLIIAVEHDDLLFLDRFYELIIFMADKLLKMKSSEVMEMLYTFFHKFHQRVQDSRHRDIILSDFRKAVAACLQILMDGGYAPMLKGLIVGREKELIAAIRQKNFQEAEGLLAFAREWIAIGLQVRGHSLIVRGFAKIYVATTASFETAAGYRTKLVPLDLCDTTAVTSQELVKLIEMYHATRSLGLDSFAGGIRDVLSKTSDCGEDTIRAKIEDVCAGGAKDRWEWDRDEVPWWDECCTIV